MLPWLLACALPPDVPLVDPADTATVAETDTETDTDVPATDEVEPSDSPDLVETVDVGHPRELRALYVATVYNIDWPSSASATAATQQAEIERLLDVASDAGMNAVIVQVRSEGDAMYRSSIEPWSRWLTGTQGRDPGYDPLQRWIDGARARGIEVHAWLNPYRARVGSESTAGLADGHMVRDFPAYAYPYSGDVWMDPGADDVHDRVVDVVEDLLANYDLDGVHFDDYFYPYRDDGDFPDDATWDAAGVGGERDDWRRSNTARLVASVADATRRVDPALRFGVAPFGIWRPGFPAGIAGMDAYDELYADPLSWVAAGDVDYLAPQLYWETTRAAQDYDRLATWWNDQLDDQTWLFPANALYQLGSTATWTVEEFGDQIAACRDPARDRTRGNLWYNASALLDDLEGVQAAFAADFYPTPALPPPVNAIAGVVEDPPVVTVDGRWAGWDEVPGRRVVTVYAEDGAGWRLDRVVPAGEGQVALRPGRWAIASVGRGDVESRGVVVTIE